MLTIEQSNKAIQYLVEHVGTLCVGHEANGQVINSRRARLYFPRASASPADAIGEAPSPLPNPLPERTYILRAKWIRESSGVTRQLYVYVSNDLGIDVTDYAALDHVFDQALEALYDRLSARFVPRPELDIPPHPKGTQAVRVRIIYPGGMTDNLALIYTGLELRQMALTQPIELAEVRNRKFQMTVANYVALRMLEDDRLWEREKTNGSAASAN